MDIPYYDTKVSVNRSINDIERLHAQIQRLKIARGRWRGITTRLKEVSDE